MSMKETLCVNEQFLEGPPLKPELREEIYLLCADCDKNFTSNTTADWISDDGYTGLCSKCWNEYDFEECQKIKNIISE